MGTRSNTVVMDGGQQLVRIYRQFDGYPSGIGEDIKKALDGGKCKIVNGYSGGQQNPKFFNGMGCLAAHLISELKDGIGGVYIISGKKASDGAEYEYILSEERDDVHLEVRDVYKKSVIYNGLLADFDGKAIEKREEEKIK